MDCFADKFLDMQAMLNDSRKLEKIFITPINRMPAKMVTNSRV